MPSTYGAAVYGQATYGSQPGGAFGSAVTRVQALVPVEVWGDPAGGSWVQTAALCLGLEMQHAWDAIAWIVQQAYPARADENGLAYWEQLLALPLAPVGWTTAQRREAVLSRRRVGGPVTVPAVQALIAQYQQGDALINWSPTTATLTILWTNLFGIPPHQDDVQRVLNAYLPAWIAIAYAYTYVIYQAITQSGWTYGQVTAQGWTYAQLETASQFGAPPTTYLAVSARSIPYAQITQDRLTYQALRGATPSSL